MGSFAESSSTFNSLIDWQIASYGKALPDHGKLWCPTNHLSYSNSPPSGESFDDSPVSGKPDNVAGWSQLPYNQEYCSEEASVSSRSSSHQSLEECIADEEASSERSVSSIQSGEPLATEKANTKLAPPFVCDHPSCKNTTIYKRKYDLERHQKRHRSEEKGSWYCGCCKLEGKTYKSWRKDHVSQHLRGKHSLEVCNPGYPCAEKLCCKGGTLLFSSTCCLNEHLVLEHGPGESNSCHEGERVNNVSITRNNAYNASTASNLGQHVPHDCRNTTGFVTSQRKRPLTNSTQEQPGEPQPELKRGRYQDSTTSHSTNRPICDSKGPNSSLVLVAEDTGIISSSFPSGFQDPCAAALPNDFDFIYPNNTTISSTYNPYTDPPTWFPSSAPTPFEILHHVDPFLEEPLWRADVEHSVMIEISNVHPADFVALALQKSDCLRTLEEFLRTAVTALRTVGVAFITYNTTRGAIQLRGPARAAQQVRLKLQDILNFLLHRAGLQVMKRSSTRWSNAFADEMHSNPTKRVGEHETAGKQQLHTFAVRSEDKVLINAWNDIISPVLPSILGPRIGRSYAVNLVRLGSSEVSARPYIRIQSPRLLSPYLRKEIREAIRNLCIKGGLASIQLRFSTGSVKLLATDLNQSLSGGQKQDEVEAEDAWEAIESDDDVQEFPSHKRYWKYPGSGASIGLHCTRSVSATLGGYISVDGRPYLLAVDHFIDKSKEICSSPLVDQLVLTSPSLSDVDDMSAQLFQSIQGVRAHISSLCKDLGKHELSRDNLPEPVKDLQRTEEALRELRGELEKTDEEFELGKLAHRFRTISRGATFPTPSASRPSKRVNHRMDWAMFGVNERQGENRHRYRYENDTMALTSDRLTGDGRLCQATCDPEPDMKVYFVGQRSGRQRGTVHRLLSIVCMDGVVTEEWSIIVHRNRPQEEWSGDSGAWVYREGNGKVVGQLWGLQDGLLLFTPIHVVFADIRDTLEANHVGLHPGFGIPEPIPVTSIANSTNTIQICEVKDKTKMPRRLGGYKLGTIPPIKSRPANPSVRPSVSSNIEMEDSTTKSQTTTERTQSSTPKLSFSPSYPSDLELEPPTPTSSPCLAKPSYVKPLPSGLNEAADPTPVMIRPADEDERYGQSLDHLDQLDSLLSPPTKSGDLHDGSTQGDSILIHFLLGDQAEQKRSNKPPSLKDKYRLLLRKASKSYTWPVTTDHMGLKLLNEAIPMV